MKSTGIVRKVDELGRIVLPIELRRSMDISEKDELEIFIENDHVVLRKVEHSCTFCGNKQNLQLFRNKNICRDCIRQMVEK